jgi:hypothetical protein
VIIPSLSVSQPSCFFQPASARLRPARGTFHWAAPRTGRPRPRSSSSRDFEFFLFFPSTSSPDPRRNNAARAAVPARFSRSAPRLERNFLTCARSTRLRLEAGASLGVAVPSSCPSCWRSPTSALVPYSRPPGLPKRGVSVPVDHLQPPLRLPVPA